MFNALLVRGGSAYITGVDFTAIKIALDLYMVLSCMCFYNPEYEMNFGP